MSDSAAPSRSPSPDFWSSDILGVYGRPRNRMEMRLIHRSYTLLKRRFNNPDAETLNEGPLNASQMEMITWMYDIRSRDFALYDTQFNHLRGFIRDNIVETRMAEQGMEQCPPFLRHEHSRQEVEGTDSTELDGELERESSSPVSDSADNLNGQYPVGMDVAALPTESRENGGIETPDGQPVNFESQEIAGSNGIHHSSVGVQSVQNSAPVSQPLLLGHIDTGDSNGQHPAINGILELEENEFEEEAESPPRLSAKTHGKRKAYNQETSGPALAARRSSQPDPSHMSNSNNQHSATEFTQYHQNIAPVRSYSQPEFHTPRSSSSHHQKSYSTPVGQNGGRVRQPSRFGPHRHISYQEEVPIQMGAEFTRGGLTIKFPIDSHMNALMAEYEQEDRAEGSGI